MLNFGGVWLSSWDFRSLEKMMTMMMNEEEEDEWCVYYIYCYGFIIYISSNCQVLLCSSNRVSNCDGATDVASLDVGQEDFRFMLQLFDKHFNYIIIIITATKNKHFTSNYIKLPSYLESFQYFIYTWPFFVTCFGMVISPWPFGNWHELNHLGAFQPR